MPWHNIFCFYGLLQFVCYAVFLIQGVPPCSAYLHRAHSTAPHICHPASCSYTIWKNKIRLYHLNDMCRKREYDALDNLYFMSILAIVQISSVHGIKQ
jgi:hypothetical protein